MNESTRTGTSMGCVCEGMTYSHIYDTRHHATYSFPLREDSPHSCSSRHIAQKQISAQATDEPNRWAASYPVACVDHIDQIINYPSLS